MKRLAVCVVLLAGTLVSAGGANPASATKEDPPPGVGIRLLEAPLATADDPRARIYIIDHVAPGTTIERRIEVSNGTDSQQEVSIYPAAASIKEGAFSGAADRTQNELSGWISVDPPAADLPANTRAVADVSISVPRNAVRGERYAAIWAEMTTPPSDGRGVTQVSRAGIRVYLSVGPGGAPPTDFAITSLKAARDDKGLPTVYADVRNTGQRAIDLAGELNLTEGPGQLSAGPFTTESGATVGIGETSSLTVHLDPQLPRGPWTAQLVVTSGTERRTAKATLTFPKRVGTSTPADIENRPWLPWVLLAVILLMVLAAALVFVVRRRAQRHNADAS